MPELRRNSFHYLLEGLCCNSRPGKKRNREEDGDNQTWKVCPKAEQVAAGKMLTSDLMKLELVGKKENKAMQRNELVLQAKDAKLTPSRKELRPKIAAMANAKEENVVIESIQHPFGAREATIKASVYENAAALKIAGQGHLAERHLGKKKEKKEKKPAGEKEEAAKEETPAEAKEAVKQPEGKEGQQPAEKKEEQGKGNGAVH